MEVTIIPSIPHLIRVTRICGGTAAYCPAQTISGWAINSINIEGEFKSHFIE